MVCPRCIAAVRQVFTDMGLTILLIELGKVVVANDIEVLQKEKLEERLSALGFELLDDKNTQLINNIKSIVVQKIHYEEEAPTVNFSTLRISEPLIFFSRRKNY